MADAERTRERPVALIIGGGLAGLCAGVRAAELGVDVTILEAGYDERYLCNSRLAMGFINVAFHDVDQPPAQLHTAIMRATGGDADPTMVHVLANNAAAAVAWLRTLGVRTIVGNWRPGSATMLAPPAAIGPGLDWPGRGADLALRLLAERLHARGGQIRRGACARRLLLHNGTCVGVEAEVGGSIEIFTAAAVVIADGGFAGDHKLSRVHLAPVAQVLQRNAGTAIGDGLRMAEAAGARLSSLGGFYGHVQSADALTNPRLWPYPTCDHLCGAGIVVDSEGCRFADEGMGGVYLANKIARLTGSARAFALFDHAAWMTRATAFPLPANPLLATVGATIHSATSIAGVAAVAGLPPDMAAATVAAYNHALATNTGNALTPPRSAALLAPLPLHEPPFYAVPVIAGITYTTGGILIDGDCRVQHRDGGIIGGLYAAGSATGGHEGGAGAGYTGGLSKALVFGKRAGETIAADHLSHVVRSRSIAVA